MAQPCIKQFVGLGQERDRLARVSVFEGGLTFDDLPEGLRLVLQPGCESIGQRLGSDEVTRLNEGSCGQEIELIDFTVFQRAFGGLDRDVRLALQQPRLGIPLPDRRRHRLPESPRLR